MPPSTTDARLACPMCGAARGVRDISCPACGERLLDPLIHSPYADQRERIEKALRIYRQERIPLIVTMSTITIFPYLAVAIQVISAYQSTGLDGAVRMMLHMTLPLTLYLVLSIAPVAGTVEIGLHLPDGALLLYRGLWVVLIASLLMCFCGAVIFIPLLVWANRFQQAAAYLTVHEYDLRNLPEV